MWLIGGEAGFGIREAGVIFAKACSRAGYNVFGHVEYPSLIRGGHNIYQVSVDDEVFCQSRQINLLVALNAETIERHAKELTENGAIIYDSDAVSGASHENNIRSYPIPLSALAKESGGKDIVRNMVAIGASLSYAGLDFSFLEAVLKDEFRGKGQEIVSINLIAARKGYEHASDNFRDDFKFQIKARKMSSNRLVLTGNDAIGIGAIKAGCKFFAGYPMTPISALIHFMSAHAKEFGIVFRNASDEIEAINMAIGASYAGARSMTATSGGGFSLMVEAYGMAGMTETPVVIVEGTRTGPSTGLPTWTEQGDLRFVLHASQGEFPRIVAAPGDASECYYNTVEVFNLSEKYQVPAIILVDRHLAESHMSAEKFKTGERIPGHILKQEQLKRMENYRRFSFSETGISPRSVPGMQGGLFIANSYEHDEYGFYSEDPETVRKMKEKRMRKMESLIDEIPEPVLHGSEDADITLVAWGSTKLPALQAIRMLAKEGIKANLLQIIYMWPFKAERIEKILRNARQTLIAENNQTGQLAGLIREKTGIDIPNKLLKYDGRQFYAEEIADKVKQVLGER